MQKGKVKSLILGSLFTIAVPIAAYFYLKSSGYDGRIKLPPHFGISRIDSSLVDGVMVKDTLYHQVRDIRLMNQLGDSVWLNKDLEGKVLVINFFFTHCQTICPTISKNMQLLNKSMHKIDSGIHYISISVDPISDSMVVLRNYADRQNANHDKWYFLTGSKTDIYQYARQELKLELPDGNGDANDFIHPEKIVLLDKYRNIRGYYNGLDADSVRLCAEDIAYLKVERNREHEKPTH